MILLQKQVCASLLILGCSMPVVAKTRPGSWLPAGSVVADAGPGPYATIKSAINDQTNLTDVAAKTANGFLLDFMYKNFAFAKADRLNLTSPAKCKIRGGARLAQDGFESFLCSANMKSDKSQFSATFEITMLATAVGRDVRNRLGTQLPTQVEIEFTDDNSNDCDSQLHIVNTVDNAELVSRSCEQAQD